MTKTALREAHTQLTPEALCRRVRELTMREPHVDPAFRALLFEQLHEIEVEVDRLSFRVAADVLDLTTDADLVRSERRLRELEFRWSESASPIGAT